jgi:carbonic anhydrase
MEKLIRGIVAFRKSLLPLYRDTFERLKGGQMPDALFIACSDSRVVPNLFASTDPGDLFVIRNVGNLVAPCGPDGVSSADEGEFAAIEYAITQLHVKDIIVCGHSQCGAMQALVGGRDQVQLPHLRSWLAHGDSSLKQVDSRCILDPKLAPADRLSQTNVLVQLDNLLSYPLVSEGVLSGLLGLHGWWFDVANGDVYAYEEQFNRFMLIDEEEAARLLSRIRRKSP